jgi:phosphomevalonate kinase
MSAYISCPSKVLIMGGYAILDPMCVGISLATDIKFSANVTT